jgi:hypothetical protein
MNYQVFNPLTGSYTKCSTKEEAREALLSYIKEFYALNTHTVDEKIVNEHGDYAWIPSSIDTSLTIK